MWFCKSFLFLNYFKYASRQLVSQFCYFYFLLADFRYFCLQEVTSSQAMEKEAFTRCINNIHHSQNLPIKILSTDRYVSVKKLIKTDEKFKHIEHRFDQWHVAKGILKMIMQSAAKKRFALSISILSLLCLPLTKSYTCSIKPAAESFC